MSLEGFNDFLPKYSGISINLSEIEAKEIYFITAYFISQLDFIYLISLLRLIYMPLNC